MKPNQFLEVYSKFLRKFLRPPRLARQWSRSARTLKVVFDCPNIVAKNIIRKVFQQSKIKVFFKKNSKADLIVSFDLDADRAFFVDNLGRAVDSDIITRLLIWYLKPQKIVIDMRAGWLIRKFRISNFEFRIFESRVGHPFIEKKMVFKQADFGVERSGHYYFKKFFYLDSGILAAIEVINAVSRLPYKFSDFVDLLPQYYRQEINFPLNQLSSKTKADLIKKSDWRREFPNWWFSLHLSETEPLLRLDIEAVEKSQLQKQILKLKKILL
jgi:phosphomannomutase